MQLQSTNCAPACAYRSPTRVKQFEYVKFDVHICFTNTWNCETRMRNDTRVREGRFSQMCRPERSSPLQSLTPAWLELTAEMLLRLPGDFVRRSKSSVSTGSTHPGGCGQWKPPTASLSQSGSVFLNPPAPGWTNHRYLGNPFCTRHWLSGIVAESHQIQPVLYMVSSTLPPFSHLTWGQQILQNIPPGRAQSSGAAPTFAPM